MIQNLFEITRPYPGNWRTSRIFDTATPRGTALGSHASDPTKAIVANGKNFLGFVIRDVVVGGPVLADHVYPNRLELPYMATQEVSVEKADEVVAEGNQFLLLSGTGLLSGSTAVDTLCSFSGGLFYVAQAGDTALYKVSAQLTPVVSGGVRIRFEAVR